MATWTTAGSLDLVGREEELRALDRAAEGHPLVTLRGPGGVGKTRLLRVWAHRRDVPVVELAGQADAAGMVHAVAAVLGSAVDPVRALDEAVERVGARLSGRWLALDNVEQIAGAAAVVDAWVQVGARLVATSRRSLGAAGEAVLPVAPLSRAAAVALFERRAGRAWDRESVGSLVDAVDAMPFAIELAAGRATLLSPTQMRARVQELAGGDARHASVTACLDWSWDLLAPARRAQCAALCLFRTPWTLGDAEAVLGPDAAAAVEELLDASLLLRCGEDPVRFTAYELVRGFAAPRAPEPLARQWRARVLARADAVDREALLALRPELRAVLEHPGSTAVERARVRASLAPVVAVASAEWLPWFATHEADAAACGRELDASASVALARAQQMAGRLDAAELTLEACLARLGDGGDDAARGSVRAQRAQLRVHTGRWTEARRDLEAATAVLEGDALALAYERLGDVHRLEERLDAAEAAQRRALGLYTSSGNRLGQASCWAHLAHVAGRRGDRDAAIAAYERAEALATTHWDRAAVLVNRLNYEASSGDARAALALVERALTATEALGSKQLRALVLACACVASLAAGESPAQALARGARALPALLEVGQHATAARVRMMNAAARILGGELAAAEASVHAACEASARAGAPPPRTAAAWRVFLAVLEGETPDVDALDEAHLPDALARAVAAGELECVRALAARAERGGELAGVRVAARIARHCIQPRVAVAADGSWVRSGEERHDLRRRGAARRMLIALARDAGQTVSSEALIEAGWPAERILADAARMRLHTAIRTLRTLGLAEVLLTVEGGYRLDAEVREP